MFYNLLNYSFVWNEVFVVVQPQVVPRQLDSVFLFQHHQLVPCDVIIGWFQKQIKRNHADYFRSEHRKIVLLNYYSILNAYFKVNFIKTNIENLKMYLVTFYCEYCLFKFKLEKVQKIQDLIDTLLTTPIILEIFKPWNQK